MSINELDKTDLRILDVLQRDASLSTAQIAERVGVTAPTAWRRILKLEKEGVITGRHAAINPISVGLGLTVYVKIKLVNGSREHLINFARAIQKMPEIVECVTITGDASFLLRVLVRDTAAYDAFFLDSLSSLPGLLSTDSAIVLSTIKSSPLLPLGNTQRRGTLTSLVWKRIS
jgi:DNA-binding Lrp family transcriptional regulator